MSRRRRPVALDEVVPLALDGLGPTGAAVVVDVPDDLPAVLADPGLLERVVANLVGNALRYSPPAAPPVIAGSSLGDRVELRVVDRGPGIPPAELDRSSRRSSDWVTPTTPPGSGSGWPCRAA